MTKLKYTSQNEQPILISDNGEDIISEIIVSRSGELESLEVQVNINHLFVDDLEVSVIHPNGIEVMLHKQNGESIDNFKTEYSGAIFADLLGTDSIGIWKLKVRNNSSGDSGHLNSWGLIFPYEMEPVPKMIATNIIPPIEEEINLSTADDPEVEAMIEAVASETEMTEVETVVEDSIEKIMNSQDEIVVKVKESTEEPAPTESIGEIEESVAEESTESIVVETEEPAVESEETVIVKKLYLEGLLNKIRNLEERLNGYISTNEVASEEISEVVSEEPIEEATELIHKAGSIIANTSGDDHQQFIKMGNLLFKIKELEQELSDELTKIINN